MSPKNSRLWTAQPLISSARLVRFIAPCSWSALDRALGVAQLPRMLMKCSDNYRMFVWKSLVDQPSSTPSGIDGAASVARRARILPRTAFHTLASCSSRRSNPGHQCPFPHFMSVKCPTLFVPHFNQSIHKIIYQTGWYLFI